MKNVRREITSIISLYLEKLERQGKSSPAGIHWQRVFSFIAKHQPAENQLENPLILNGSIAPNSDKRDRFRDHLIAAAFAGVLTETLEMLDQIPDDGWNVAPASTWHEQHPWLDEGF